MDQVRAATKKLADAGANLLPLGCNPDSQLGTPCETIGPLDGDPGVRDPVAELVSDGDETLYVKINEADFVWGSHAWYVATFELL